MSSNNVAISVTNLTKCYEIYTNPIDRLKQFILPRIQKLIGIESRRYYREFLAIKDVSFDINKGETVGIIGRNGSGKSTLLQMICGTLYPSAGSVYTRGRIAALLELGSGFNPEYSGRENVYLNAAVLGLSKKQIEECFDDIVAFADIGEFIDQPVKTYSSGMYVRLAFAIQAHVEPDILIIDEALAVGDTFFVHRCMSRFHELKSKGVTILLVSHDTTAIKTLCDKAIWIKNGRMQEFGDACNVSDNYLKDEDKGMTHLNAIAYAKRGLKNNEIVNSNDLKVSSVINTDYDYKMIIEDVMLLDESNIKIEKVSSSKPVNLIVTIRNNAISHKTPLVIGYILKNIRGIDISSSNNEIEFTEILAPEQGCTAKIQIRFSIPYLHCGQYAITISLGARDLSGVMNAYDLKENIIQFELLETKKCYVLMTFETSYNLIK